MSSKIQPDGRTRRRKLIKFVLGSALLLILVAAGWYLTSPGFQERMRVKVIATIQRMTGGRTEVQSFRWNLSRLQFEISGLTIHGKEAPGEAPYAHVDRVLARLKIISLLEGRIGLRYLELDRPVVHLVVYPDGSTNQPALAVNADLRSGVSRIFDLVINRFEVKQGTLLVNQRAIPLDFSAQDLAAGMHYDHFRAHYGGEVSADTVNVKYGELAPLRSRARLRFTLWRNHAELLDMRWDTARSHIEGSGTLRDYAHPRLELQYTASLDPAELEQLAVGSGLAGGRLQLEGKVVLSADELSSSGRLSARGVAYHLRTLHLTGVDLTGNYLVQKQHLLLSGLNGRALGGNFAGDAEITRWTPSPSVIPAGKAGHRQRCVIRLRASGIQVAALADALGSETRPLVHMHAVGTATGTADIQWTGASEDAEAAVALEVTPPASAASAELPLTASLRLRYLGAEDRLEIEQFQASARATRATAAGVLGARTAHLALSLTTSRLGEVRPVLESLGVPRLPAHLEGEASFQGTLTGSSRAPILAGHVEATNFDYFLASEPRNLTVSASPPRSIHWDSLALDLESSAASFGAHHGKLKRGSAEIDFDITAGLMRGNLVDASPIRGRIEVRNVDLQDVQSLAGYNYPITGRLISHVNIGGTWANLDGGGTLRVTGGSIYGEPFRELRADIRLSGPEVQLANLALSHNAAKVTGLLAYNLKTHGFRTDLAGSNIALADFQLLQTARFKFAGQLNFTLSGSGTLEAPVINANVHILRLLLNGDEAGDVDAKAVTHGADMRLTARTHFQNAELAVDGNVRLRDEFPASITLRFAHLDINPVLHAYLQGRITGHSQIAGAVDLSGPLRRPRDLNITARVDQFSAEVEKVRLESSGPVRFTLRDEILTLESLHLIGDGTDIQTSGTVRIGGLHELRLRTDGQVNLTLLRTLNHDIAAEGLTQIHVSVGGTTARPNLAGEIRIQNGSISYVDLPNGLSNLNGVLVFNENLLQVKSLTAQTGGGTLNVGGVITYSRGLNFNLTITSRDIRLRYPPGVSSVADANLRFSGTTRNALLAGDVTVTRFGINPRFDFAQYLASSKQTPTIPSPDSPLNSLHLDVHITTTPELQVETSLARISGDADLRLRGTAAHPILLGRVDIAEGDLFFNSTKYHVEQGEILFLNPLKVEPVLNLEATARVRDYDVTLGFHGPLNKISTTYHSDPPLPTADIIALLALGRTQEEAVVNQPAASAVTQSASNALLGQALNSAVSSRMQKLFGISRIKIDPEVGGPENNPNARVTIEQQVSNRVTLTFISNLSQSAQEIFQVEYQVNKRVSIVALRDQNGVLSFDVKYRQRKR